LSDRWLNSDGGPLICATPFAGSKWRGVRGSSVGDARTDYNRACDERDYLGVIPSGELSVLVLGDEPLQSRFAIFENELAIVRWVSCESNERATRALASLPDQLPVLGNPCPLSVDDSRLYLFDAALDMPKVGASGSCAVDVRPGRYSVTIESYKRDRAFDFLIHRFRWLPVS
jgi:hypothetical protein